MTTDKTTDDAERAREAAIEAAARKLEAASLNVARFASTFERDIEQAFNLAAHLHTLEGHDDEATNMHDVRREYLTTMRAWKLATAEALHIMRTGTPAGGSR